MLEQGATADSMVGVLGTRERCAVRMKSPPHPGLSVRHDCLEPLGLTVTEAAKRLGVRRKQLSGIVNGRAGISPEMLMPE